MGKEIFNTVLQGLKFLWKQPRALTAGFKQTPSASNEHPFLKFPDTLVNLLTSGMINIFKFVARFNDPLIVRDNII